MAKVRLNPTIEQYRGKLGDLVFKRVAHKIVVGPNPDRSGLVATPGQLAHQARFREAAAYGKAVFADPVRKAVYEAVAKAKDVPAFSLTIGDFFNGPVVDAIDRSGYTGKVGEVIALRAHDDIQVAGVAVAIKTPTGTVLEQGAAVKQAGEVWRYTTTVAVAAGQAVMIEVTATDLPGNKAVQQEAVPAEE